MFDSDAGNWQVSLNLEYSYNGVPMVEAWASERFILSVSADFWY